MNQRDEPWRGKTYREEERDEVQKGVDLRGLSNEELDQHIADESEPASLEDASSFHGHP